jgi:hypothetical protein
MLESVELQPGQRVSHNDLGEGVVVEAPRDGYVRAFFAIGERRVPVSAIRRQLSRAERILSSVEGSRERLKKI